MNELTSHRRAEIQNFAASFREEAGLADEAPLNDIVELIRSEGYEYVEEQFPSMEHSGFVQATGNSSRFKISYNSSHNFGDPYKRFTLCHELGHANIPGHIDILMGNGHYSKPEYQIDDKIELEADYFSICLLAPKSGFKKIIENKEFTVADIQAVATYFGISIYAASLRFVELTDICCSLVISDSSGNIRFEKRSPRMSVELKNPYLYREKINSKTLSSRAINQSSLGGPDLPPEKIRLSTWYPDVPNSVDANESVHVLKYNKTILTYLNPLTDEFVE